MFDPRSIYVIYKQQETERMLKIERKLAARAQTRHAVNMKPRFLAAGQWLKAHLFARGSAKRQTTAAECSC